MGATLKAPPAELPLAMDEPLAWGAPIPPRATPGPSVRVQGETVFSVQALARCLHPVGTAPNRAELAALATAPATQPAAVLLPLVMGTAGPELLFILRAANLRRHPGQVGFPGGHWEPADPDTVATALRETLEEIGVAERDITVLGLLAPVDSRSGHRIHPVVGWLPGGCPALRLDPREIAATFTLPLAQVAAKVAPFLTPRPMAPVTTLNAPDFRHGEYRIWGVTAILLADLFLRTEALWGEWE